MTVPATKSTRSRFARYRRFLVRVVLWATTVLVVLLALLWLLRQHLVAPLLRPEIEAVLRDALAADRVHLGAFDGDWLTGIHVPEITIEGARTPLRHVLGAQVTAEYSLFALLRGDLAGLRTVQVSIAAAELDLGPAPAPTTADEGATGPIDQDLLRRLLRLCPGGATVQIDHLRVRAPAGDRLGRLAMTLDAGGDERRVFLTYPGVTLDVHVPAPEPDRFPRVTAEVDVAAPGELLDLFGLGGGASGGRLRAAVSATLQPLGIEASIQLEDLQHGDRRLAQSHATARLDAERLAIAEAMFDLPGVQVAVRAFELPNPWRKGSDLLRDATGACTVRLVDLAPYAELLPMPVRDLLPIQGQLAGSIGGGLLRLEAGELHARGADLVLAAGSFALDAADWRAAAAALHVDLTLDAFAPPLPESGQATLSGNVRGTLRGSLDAPAADVTIELGACGSEHGSFTRAAGSVHADRNGIRVTGLHVVGLVVPASGSTGESDLRLDASCRLRDGTIDPDSLAATFDLDSQVPTAVLQPIFAAQGLGPAPAGPVTLHVQAHHDDDGVTVAALRLRTADESPITVVIDGSGRVPLHWNGGAELQTLDEGTLVVQAAAQRPAVADTPAASFAGTINLAARTITLQDLALRAGAFGLRGELTAARGIGDLVAPDLDIAAVPLRLALDLEELDLARVPASWLSGIVLQGRVTGHVASTGTAKGIDPGLRLVWTDGALRAPDLPELTAVQLQIETAASTPGAVIVLTAQLSADVADGAGGRRRLATSAAIRCDDEGTRLLPTELSFGDALVTADLATNLRRSDLQRGVFFGPATTLTGTIRCRDLSLDALPAGWLGAPLRGRVNGEVQLAGTVGPDFAATIVQSARLSVHGGEGKFPGAPRVEEFAAEATYDANALVLHSLSCLLGAGRVTANGSLRHPDRPLRDSWQDAPLAFRLTGENVLLHRGDGARVRASVHMTATGTPSAIALGGEVTLGRGSKYVRRITLMPDLQARGGGAPGEGLDLPALPPAIGSRLALDIALRTDAPFEVRTDLFDGEIDVAAHLRGTGSEPRLEGAASARRGILRFPGANLHLTSGQLTFTRGEPHHPSLQIRAEGKRMGFQVSMTVSGPYDRPEVLLTSVPTLEPQQIIVLLTTGQLPSTLVEGGTLGQARLVGGYLAKEAYASLFGSESTERGDSLLDRLTIEAGREVSKNGVESVLVEYDLLPNLALRAERDAYEDYNLGIVLRWRFR